MICWDFCLPPVSDSVESNTCSPPLASATCVVPEQRGGVASALLEQVSADGRRRADRCGPVSSPGRSPPPKPTWPRCSPRSNAAGSTRVGVPDDRALRRAGISSSRPHRARALAEVGRAMTELPVVAEAVADGTLSLRQGQEHRAGRRPGDRTRAGRHGAARDHRADPADLRASGARSTNATTTDPDAESPGRAAADGVGGDRRRRHRAAHPVRSRPRRARARLDRRRSQGHPPRTQDRRRRRPGRTSTTRTGARRATRTEPSRSSPSPNGEPSACSASPNDPRPRQPEGLQRSGFDTTVVVHVGIDTLYGPDLPDPDQPSDTGPNSTGGGTRWASSNPPAPGSDVTSPAGWPATPDCSPSSKTDDGNPLHIGQRKSSIPLALRRAVMARYRTCAWPGCTATAVQLHHTHHRAAGGHDDVEIHRPRMPRTPPAHPHPRHRHHHRPRRHPPPLAPRRHRDPRQPHRRSPRNRQRPRRTRAAHRPTPRPRRRPPRDRPPTPLARRPRPPRRLHRRHPNPTRPSPPTHPPHPPAHPPTSTDEAGARDAEGGRVRWRARIRPPSRSASPTTRPATDAERRLAEMGTSP